jgi:phosphate starvation-inducible PhoH-like protein
LHFPLEEIKPPFALFTLNQSSTAPPNQPALETHKSISIAETDLRSLFGRNDQNLALIEKKYGVSLVARGDKLLLYGPSDAIQNATDLLTHLIERLRSEPKITEDELKALIQQGGSSSSSSRKQAVDENIIKTYRTTVKVRTEGQADYLQAMTTNDIVFAIGPAGTGKTYLAVAAAVAALRQKQVSRIVLTRPAVEAGENLGFLPGALEEKVDPYLRPLYDALQDLLEPDRLRRFQEMKVVEVVPLAYMRGRTLNDAFIILDEAQNTTPQQMKMFLTRLGSLSKAIITGDITQIDLPQEQPSGLIEVQKFLTAIEGLAFIYLTQLDVIRNPLVQEVIKAYEKHEQSISPPQLAATGR